MAIVRTSPRVFGLAGGLIVVFNGVIAATAIGSMPEGELPTPDRAFQNFSAQNAIFIGLLVVGHVWLKRSKIGTRAAYALMGGAAAALAYAFALNQGLLFKPPFEGTRLTAGILPTIIGMIAGTLYNHFAGYEPSHTPPVPAIDIAAQAEVAPVPVVPLTFDGPVQVRTSFAATALAAMVPAACVTLISLFYFGMVSAAEYTTTPTRSSWSIESIGSVMSGYLFMIVLIVTIIPGAVAIQMAHGVARALKRTDYPAYTGAGAGVGLVGALVLMTMSPIPLFGVLMIVAGAVMGAIYRRLAGIEALALPEIILATDKATLVGLDHPARRTRTVIMNG